MRAVDVGQAGVEVHTDSRVERASAAVLTVPPSVVARGTLSLEGLARTKVAAAAALRSVPGRVTAYLLDEPATASGFAFYPNVGLATWYRGSSTITLVSKGRPALAPPPQDLVDHLLIACEASTRPEPFAVHDWTQDQWAGGAFTTAKATGSEAARWAEPVGALALAGEACGAGPTHPYLDRALQSAAHAVDHLSDLTAKELTHR